MVKDLILRKNKEFNSLDRTQQKEILDRIQNQIKESKAQSAKTINPDDEMPFASGGLARVGMAGGGILKEFIEKLFIKASNDIRQGKGLFKGLNQEQMITQHDNLTKMLKKWEMSGKKGLPEGAEQFIGMNDLQVTKAIKDATSEVEINKVLNQAYDEVAGGSGFSDDYKMAADQLSDSIAEQLGKNFDDLSQTQQTQIQNIALKRTTQDLKKRLSQQTAEGIQDGTIDISDPKVAEEFTAFIKKSDPEGYKKLEQKIKSDDLFDAEGKLNKKAVLQEVKDSEEKMLLDKFDVKGRTKQASGGIAGQLHLNEGGRVPMIFGGSAGLKGLIASIKAGLNKSRSAKDKIKTLFPKYSADEKELLKLGEKYLPKDSATLAAKEIEAKAEGIQVLIDRLKHDKKLLERQAKNKAMNDPNLDFMMESLEKTMPEAYGPHLKKYTNIDKDILQLETIKKNLIMKDRKLHASGGIAEQLHMNRPGYANGEEVYGPALPEKKKKEKKKKKKEEEEKMRPPETYADPFWQYGLRFPTEEKPGTRVDPTEGIGFDSFGDIDVDLTDPRFKLGIYDPEENYYPWDFEIGKGDIGFKWKKKFGGPKKLNKGGRASLSNGGLANILGV
jgi:hypothetical protein